MFSYHRQCLVCQFQLYVGSPRQVYPQQSHHLQVLTTTTAMYLHQSVDSATLIQTTIWHVHHLQKHMHHAVHHKQLLLSNSATNHNFMLNPLNPTVAIWVQL